MDAVKNRDDLLSIKEEYLRRQKSSGSTRMTGPMAHVPIHPVTMTLTSSSSL